MRLRASSKRPTRAGLDLNESQRGALKLRLRKKIVMVPIVEFADLFWVAAVIRYEERGKALVRRPAAHVFLRVKVTLKSFNVERHLVGEGETNTVECHR